MPGDDHKEERERIVNFRLTRELGSHDYLIGRTEAKTSLKLKVVDVPADLENGRLSGCSRNTSAKMVELRQPLQPRPIIGVNAQLWSRSIAPSWKALELTTVFRTKREIERIQMQIPGMMGMPAVRPKAFQERTTFESWIEDQDI